MVFPFGEVIAPLPGPLPSSPHGPARPPRSPRARRRSSSIVNQLVILITSSLFDPGAATLDIPAALPPEEAPIMITSPQDLHLTIYDHKNEIITRGVPPGERRMVRRRPMRP